MKYHLIRACSALLHFAGVGLWLFAGPLVVRSEEPVAEAKAVATPIDETPISEVPITDGDRAHWAFSPVVRPDLPAVSQPTWLRTPVDTFILVKQEKHGLGSAAEAGRPTLLRRLSFDLTGLPPTPEQLVEFQSNTAPDAYERLVDQLLASPAFGDRYGQHWLDLARFAETDGFEHDKVRSNAWQYRDWVIEAINADLPYDEFVRQQLAGDEESAGSGIPTMFCLAGPDMPDINDQVERRHNRLNELTATVGSVFLGLQLGCAQCHDHKYDPLSQGDFYRLRAVFESSVPPLKRDVPYYKLTEQKAVEPARFWIRGDHRRPGIEVQAGFPRIATPPAGSDSDELQDESEAVVLRPQFRSRTELANWLMRDDNPLTSRVIVNRLWQHHFGRGIVTTPGDFGLLGAAPTHPELLDWLAVELREQGWSQKHLHRMIVNSATYRQRSQLPQVDPPAGNATVIDECYARFPRRRLDGEAIRDSLLFAAGLLTAERGGPGVMPPLPEELIGTLLKGQWKTSERETDHYRRSIYVFARRNLRYPLFEAFDRPDGNASCALRSRSTTAPQSLLLLNSELSLLAARHLAERLVEHSPESAEQVDALFRLTLARSINSGEQRQLLDFLAGQRERLIADARPDDLAKNGLPTARKNPVDSHAMAALVDLCLAVLNSSEFLYID